MMARTNAVLYDRCTFSGVESLELSLQTEKFLRRRLAGGLRSRTAYLSQLWVFRFFEEKKM